MLDFFDFTHLPADEDDAPRPRANDKFRRFVHAYARNPRLPMLKRDEELNLIAAYKQDGSAAALDKLVAHHVPLVMNLAIDYAGKNGMEWAVEDLVSEGYKSFIKAIGRYKPTRDKARLGHFARYHVAGAILTYALRNKNPFAFGTSSAERTVYLNRNALEAEFLERHGRAFDDRTPADVEQMAALAGATASAVRRVYQLRNGGNPIPQEKIEIHDRSLASQPERQIMERERKAILGEVLSSLAAAMKPRNRDILVQLLFAEAEDVATVRQELAGTHGITPERIGQIYRAGLEDLRIALNKRGISSSFS